MLLEKDGSNALIGDNLGNGTPHHGLRGGKSCMASSIGNLEEECRIWLNHNKPRLDFSTRRFPKMSSWPGPNVAATGVRKYASSSKFLLGSISSSTSTIVWYYMNAQARNRLAYLRRTSCYHNSRETLQARDGADIRCIISNPIIAGRAACCLLRHVPSASALATCVAWCSASEQARAVTMAAGRLGKSMPLASLWL